MLERQGLWAGLFNKALTGWQSVLKGLQVFACRFLRLAAFLDLTGVLYSRGVDL